MNKFLIKAIVVIIAGSLAGGTLFYFWKNKYAFSQDQIAPLIEELSNNKGKKDLKKSEENKKIPDGKAEIINYLEKNISKISPEKAANGLLWHPVKIWFINDKNFYVDYRDEVLNARRLLVFQSNAGPVAEYKILGFFAPGKNGWILKSGRDIEGTTSFKLYEKNEKTGEWIVK